MVEFLSLAITIVAIVAVSVIGLMTGLLVMGIDRKLTAHMQARVGPPILQPFIDVRKLLLKENVVPENAIPWLFNAAPVFGLASSLTILLYLPIGGVQALLGGNGDVILIMYLLTMPALAMVAGGFASGSPYATVGAQREMVTMISYELPLAIVFIAIAWRLSQAGITEPFTLAAITSTPIWDVVGPLGIIGCLLLLFVLILITPGELSRIPFDTPEAETELAGGLLVEYSGRNLAMFYLAQGVKTVVMASLIVTLFLPWSIAAGMPGIGLEGTFLDALFYFVKILAVIFVAVSLIRVTVARFRINQVVTIYWWYVGGIGILALILLLVDAAGGV